MWELVVAFSHCGIVAIPIPVPLRGGLPLSGAARRVVDRRRPLVGLAESGTSLPGRSSQSYLGGWSGLFYPAVPAIYRPPMFPTGAVGCFDLLVCRPFGHEAGRLPMREWTIHDVPASGCCQLTMAGRCLVYGLHRFVHRTMVVRPSTRRGYAYLGRRERVSDVGIEQHVW